jgi:hypothetical protein
MTPQEIYTLVSSVLLLAVAMMWSTQGLLNVVIKLSYYITGTLGLILAVTKFIAAVV